MSSDDSVEVLDDDVIADDLLANELAAYNLSACNLPAKVAATNRPARTRQQRS
jgi:hypothetical protein